MTGQHTGPGRDVALAVDIGGTTLKGAAVDRLGTVVGRCTLGTFDVDGAAYAGVARVLRTLGDRSRDGDFRPVGIGIASPGLVDTATGSVAFAANLGWDSLPLGRLLETEFGLPTRVDHDARAAALAERGAHPSSTRDAAPPAGADADAYRDFVLIPIGTGVSAAIVTGGAVVVGASGAAGEFGHIPAVPAGDLCACGQQGCIEAYASASNILKRYRAKGGVEATSPREIVAALDTDALARSVWHEAVEALAVGVTAVTAMLDPRTIVIGGGLSAAGDRLLDPLRARVQQRLGWRSTPQIVASALAAEGGLIGAAMLGWAGHDLPSGFANRLHRGLGDRADEPGTNPLERSVGAAP